MTKSVVGRSAVGVGQHLVRFIDFLEAFLSAVMAVDVGVVFSREPAVRALKFVGACRPVYAKNLIIVSFFGHTFLGHRSEWESGHVREIIAFGAKLRTHDRNPPAPEV